MILKIAKAILRWPYFTFVFPVVQSHFLRRLLTKTNNFSTTKWLGTPILQNVLDLWTIQETITELRPSLLIECGTNRGGSSLFYAHLFDLMNHGEVITIDIKNLHDISHPRVTYLIGNSTSDEIVAEVQKRVAACSGPVMVILDSDHSREHVLRELECFTPLVTAGSYCLVQDGIVDTLSLLKSFRPGPLPAIREFVKSHKEFEIDRERSERFLITSHPEGWLRRIQ